MKLTLNQKELTRLNNLFKAAIPERDMVGLLLGFTNRRTGTIEGLNAYEAEELLAKLEKLVKMATAKQIQKLQCLYRELGLVEQKKDLLLTFTHGRTDSTAGLTFDEARDLIQDIGQHEPAQRIRKMIFSFAYRAGIIYGETETDKKINQAKLNMFLRDRGTVKKDLEKQTMPELKKTLAQFAAVVKNTQKSTDNKEAANLTKELLTELNLLTTK